MLTDSCCRSQNDSFLNMPTFVWTGLHWWIKRFISLMSLAFQPPPPFGAIHLALSLVLCSISPVTRMLATVPFAGVAAMWEPSCMLPQAYRMVCLLIGWVASCRSCANWVLTESPTNIMLRFVSIDIWKSMIPGSLNGSVKMWLLHTRGS